MQERLRAARNVRPGPEAASSQKLQAAFHRLPLSFISNRGQVDQRVRFYSRSGSAHFFFAQDEVVYTFVQREGETSVRKVGRSTPDGDSDRQGEGKSRRHVVRLRFVGANPDPVIQGGEELPGKVNYFVGNDPAQWKRGISTYGQVRYRELWPGIDLVYRGQGGRLKYEFLVKPGAEPSRILLAYRGIEGLALSNAGDLILQTASGELRDSHPVAYQEIGGRRVAVEAGFRVEGRKGAGLEPPMDGRATHLASISQFPEGSRRGLELPPGEASPGGPASLPGADEGIGRERNAGGGVAFVHGFEVKGYDPAYPLILDPGLDYSTFLGGSGNDWGFGIALDGTGNAFVTGET